jgi:hypothetical protein
VLLPALGPDPEAALRAADAALAPQITADLVRGVLEKVPKGWLDVDPARYVDWFVGRASGARPWFETITSVKPAMVAAARAAALAERPDPPRWLRPALGRGGRGFGRG